MKDPRVHCLKCKKKTNDVDPVVVMTKNGRFRMECTCSVCGKKKGKFVPKSEVGKKMGNGIFSWVPFVGKHLDNLGNKALDIAVPLAVGAATKRFIG